MQTDWQGFLIIYITTMFLRVPNPSIAIGRLSKLNLLVGKGSNRISSTCTCNSSRLLIPKQRSFSQLGSLNSTHSTSSRWSMTTLFSLGLFAVGNGSLVLAESDNNSFNLKKIRDKLDSLLEGNIDDINKKQIIEKTDKALEFFEVSLFV